MTFGNNVTSHDFSGTGLTASPNGALQSVSGANTYAGPIQVATGGGTITSSSTSRKRRPDLDRRRESAQETR